MKTKEKKRITCPCYELLITLIFSEKMGKCEIIDDKYHTGSRLPFKVNDKVKCFIDEASKRVQKLGDNLEMEVLHYQCYGKEFIKSQKLSPDSYIQMAMQYAFFK